VERMVFSWHSFHNLWNSVDFHNWWNSIDFHKLWKECHENTILSTISENRVNFINCENQLNFTNCGKNATKIPFFPLLVKLVHRKGGCFFNHVKANPTPNFIYESKKTVAGLENAQNHPDAPSSPPKMNFKSASIFLNK